MSCSLASERNPFMSFSNCVSASICRHNRDWRYHIEEKVWITRVPGITHYEKNGQSERGTFYYFDAQNWRRVPKDFQIDANKLDKCPNLGAIMSISGQTA